MIRMAFVPEDGLIEEEPFARYEDILAVRAEGTIRDYNRIGKGRLNGYEICEFYLHDLFKSGDAQFEVYKWDIAFTTPDAGELELAGGMHPDGRLRIRGMEGYTYLVVRTVDGVMGDYQFMFYDTYNGAGDESERERARELIERAWGLI